MKSRKHNNIPDPTLHVKLPPPLLKAFKAFAKKENRTMGSQARALIQEAVAADKARAVP